MPTRQITSYVPDQTSFAPLPPRPASRLAQVFLGIGIVALGTVAAVVGAQIGAGSGIRPDPLLAYGVGFGSCVGLPLRDRFACGEQKSVGEVVQELGRLAAKPWRALTEGPSMLDRVAMAVQPLQPNSFD